MKKIVLLMVTFFMITSTAFARDNTLKNQDDPSDMRSRFISSAKSYLGTPYVWGGTSRSGVDCSGFVYLSAKEAGLGELPRRAADMYYACAPIDKDELQPGDLVFFSEGGPVTHVGIYLGNNQFIHAASEGRETGVIISKLSEKYWANHYYGQKRFIPGTSPVPLTNDQNKALESIKRAEEEKEKNRAAEKTEDKSKKKTKENKSKADKDEDKLLTFTVTPALNTNFFYAIDNDYFIKDIKETFFIKGGSITTEYMTNCFKHDFGVMARLDFTLPDEGFKFDTLTSHIKIPVCVAFDLNDYFGLYAGVVLSMPDSMIHEPQLLHMSSKEIIAPIFPGYAGLIFRAPAINFGSFELSLTQEISFTYYKAAEGFAPLTLAETLSAGTTLSTGLRIAFPH